ncbi:tetratricopeptide repeat protein [Dysgonomonas sp. 520]|uniref:tetratricopeptide repeat protein n=1 Tax=Dysgonomonas sp. 520 TaxID=2302931 RepID=UPI0013D1E744|nr:tetratricopeptide repeat protein [Dysgonomonas sp. 520]NDW09430.1 tetratricopeptide repeat protein [Dysgonomonas sp. 520]
MDNIDNLFEKGIALLEEKLYNDAIKCFDEVIELNPNSAESYNFRGIAKGYAASGYSEKYIDVVEDFNKTIELSPNEAILYNNRGLANMLLGDYISAIKDYNKSIELGNTDISSYDICIDAYKLLNDFEGAKKMEDRKNVAFNLSD